MDKGDGKNFPPEKVQSDTKKTKRIARKLDFTEFSGPRTRVLSSDRQNAQKLLSPPLGPSPLPPIVEEAEVIIGEVEDPRVTRRGQAKCFCQFSQCLKLYCECFAAGVYCEGCYCKNCFNNLANESPRGEAVAAALYRNPNAFRPKVQVVGDHIVVDNKGCNCKRTRCLKKHCDCFRANIFCDKNCKCMDCKNFEGSEESSVFDKDHGNALYSQQVAANAALNAAIGSSGYVSPPYVTKRTSQETFSSRTVKDPPVHRLPHTAQDHQGRSYVPTSISSSVPVTGAVNHAAPGSLKPAYRSLLSGVIQPQEVTDLCSRLVVAPVEVAKKFKDKKAAEGKQVEKDEQRESTFASSTLRGEAKQSDLKAPADALFNENKVDEVGINESSPDNPDTRNPMSPGTLALMCDEQNTTFMGAASTVHDQNLTTRSLPNNQVATELYAEQERVVLTMLRDHLRSIIDRGNSK